MLTHLAGRAHKQIGKTDKQNSVAVYLMLDLAKEKSGGYLWAACWPRVSVALSAADKEEEEEHRCKDAKMNASAAAAAAAEQIEIDSNLGHQFGV